MTDTSELERLRALNAEMLAALQKIERWFGEFPDLGKEGLDDRPVSFGARYGSNGERDFMRGIARAAIAKAAPLPQEEK